MKKMNVDIPELVPMDDYDARQAKLEASMRWLLTKASNGSIPSQYQEAFYSMGLSSSLSSRLASSELYWAAVAALFPEVQGQVQQGHTGLIQMLTRRGVYLPEINGIEINDQLLQRIPLHLMAHITLVDGLMTAYINTILSPEKIVPAVRKFATFSASNELPTNPEEAAVFWVNKVCYSLLQKLQAASPSSVPEAVALSDVRSISDGRCLAALVSVYCPQTLPITAVMLADSLGIADSLYNLQLFHEFSKNHLPASLLSLTVMDLFYTPETLHLNLLALFADMFCCLELEKAHCVLATGQPPLTLAVAGPESQKTTGKAKPTIPEISDPTKRSFQRSVSSDRKKALSGVAARQPLLPRRLDDSSSANANHKEFQRPMREAWTQNNNNTSKTSVLGSHSSDSSLLSNVRLDASLNFDMVDTDIQMSDTFGQKLHSTSSKETVHSDPLLPAQLCPAKEKSNNHTKKCEYREEGNKKKHTASTPDENNCGKPIPQGGSSGTSSSSTPSDGYKTPSVENVTFNGAEAKDMVTAKDNTLSSSSINDSLLEALEHGLLDRNRLGGQTYIVRNHPVRFEGALAAGIPIASGGSEVELHKGCPTHYGSDQELQKLLADSADKEVKSPSENYGYYLALDSHDPSYISSKPPVHRQVGFSLKQPVSCLTNSDSKTSFAQIKKQKEADEGLKVSPGTGALPESIMGSTSKMNPMLPRTRKKATFGVLPNQTTWIQESAQRSAERVPCRSGDDAVEPMASELISLRMKLEENRRQIEHRKRLAERQWHQQRQQMGKEAFIQVITKNRTGSDEKLSSTDDDRSKSATPDFTTKMKQKSFDTEPELNEQLIKVKVPVKLEKPVSLVQREATFRVMTKDQGAANQMLKKWDKENGTVKEKDTKRLDNRIKSPSLINRENLCKNDDKNEGGTGSVEMLAQTKELSENLTDREEVIKYDDSLNKINSSLSELQGEILRLSLQQDQINSLVRSDLSQAGRIPQLPSETPHGASTPSKEDLYIQQFAGVRDSMSPSVGMSPMPSMLAPSAQNVFHDETSLHQSRPAAVPYSVPSYLSLPTSYPQHYHPSPSVPLQIGHYQQSYAAPQVSLPDNRMYPSSEAGPHPFVPIGSQYHPSSGMYPVMPGMYPVPTPTSYHSQYQSPVSHQQFHHVQSIPTVVPGPELSSGFSPHSGIPFNNFSNSLTSFSSQPPPTSFYAPVWPGPETTLSMPHSTAPVSENLPTEISSSFQFYHANAVTETSETKTKPSIELMTPVSLGENVVEVEKVATEPVHCEGFFVDLGDSNQPVRQKPSLKVRVARQKGDETSIRTSTPTFGDMPSSATTDSQGAEGSLGPVEPDAMDTKELPTTVESSPLVFVVGQSTENEDNLLEMEKKKQRLCELQLKRLEEQELRREKFQKEQERKREQQRMKQELTDQKRADEKARRDAIYQQYLQKKMESDMLEEVAPKPLAAPVIRRQKSASHKAARPKSQPALVAEAIPVEGITAPYFAHNSQDNLVMEGMRRSPTLSDSSRSNEKVNFMPSRVDQTVAGGEVSLAFGGLTHRRPTTPDNVRSAYPTTSDGSESSGTAGPENYAGPKLFVKPSQKSNRHIIINAISHCCLAGSVNKDVKNKVLEEIAKSDSKHFIILFRDAGMQYRGLYTYNPDQEEVHRIHGVGPRQLTDKVMEKFYKYNSGSKTFSEVTSTKHLSATIDAITVLSSVWQKTRPTGPVKKPV